MTLPSTPTEDMLLYRIGSARGPYGLRGATDPSHALDAVTLAHVHESPLVSYPLGVLDHCGINDILVYRMTHPDYYAHLGPKVIPHADVVAAARDRKRNTRFLTPVESQRPTQVL